jgi:hypothetical protein
VDFILSNKRTKEEVKDINQLGELIVPMERHRALSLEEVTGCLQKVHFLY